MAIELSKIASDVFALKDGEGRTLVVIGFDDVPIRRLCGELSPAVDTVVYLPESIGSHLKAAIVGGVVGAVLDVRRERNEGAKQVDCD